MTYIITEPCIGSKDTACIQVCPVDCIDSNEEQEQYYIDPSACINCEACVTVCPVNAIFHDLTIPYKWRKYMAKNKEFFK